MPRRFLQLTPAPDRDILEVMANPDSISLPADTWVLVAEDVTVGQIEVVEYSPSLYLKDYRTTGDPEPTGTSPTERQVTSREIKIEGKYGIDVYMKFIGSAASGRVVVSL